MIAKSAKTDEMIWEFQDKKGGMMMHSSEHNVLLVPNGAKERLLIVNPESGHLIQALDLSQVEFMVYVYLITR